MIPHINDSLPLDKANLIAFFLESLLHGVSTVLFIMTIYVLFRCKQERLNKRLLATSTAMMLFGTLHLIVDLIRIFQGFIVERDSIGGSVMYFARLYEWSQLLKTAIFVIQTVLADSFATYRCWVVWNHSWAAIPPALSVVGTLIISPVAGIGVVHGCAITKSGDVFASTLTAWITSFFSLTLGSNIICTSLVAYRIWFITRKAGGQQTLMPVVIVVVESGLIYSASCVTLLVLYLLGSNAQYAALDGTFPIISIVFNLIMVRIAMGVAHSGASGSQTTVPLAFGGNSHYSYASHPIPMKTYESSFTADEGRERKESGRWNAV